MAKDFIIGRKAMAKFAAVEGARLSPLLVVKVEDTKGKAVACCWTFEDIVDAVTRFSKAHPGETISVYRDAHAKDCECAHCITTVIESGVEISRDGSRASQTTDGARASELDAALRGIINHWYEFGHEHGLDERIDAAAELVIAHDKSR